MKNIKIGLCVLLLLLGSNSLLLADSSFSFEEDLPTQQVRTSVYMPTSSNRIAIGGAGLGLGGYYDSYLYNPANISKDGFKLMIPSLTITINNVNSLINPANNVENIFEIIERLEDDESAQSDLASLIINSIPSGPSQVVTFDTNVGFKSRIIGLDLALQEKLHSYKNNINDSTISLINETNIALTLALGFKLNIIKDVFSIDLGINGAYKIRAYSSSMDNISASDLLDGEAIDNYLRNSVPFAIGSATPFTVGANINLPAGLSISAVYRNINGNYYMTGYPNLISNETVADYLGENYSANSNLETFIAKTPGSLDLGLSYVPTLLNKEMLKAQFSLDCLDCYDILFNSDFAETSSSIVNKEIINALYFGSQFRLLNMIDVKAGINSNSLSFGAGFDFLVVHMDAAYSWNNNTDPISNDVFSLKFSILSR